MLLSLLVLLTPLAAASQANTAPHPWVREREVTLTDNRESVGIEARWLIQVEAPGWVDWEVTGPGVRVTDAVLNGHTVGLRALSDGTKHLVVYLQENAELQVQGELEGRLRRGVQLRLLPSAVGWLDVHTGDEVVEVAEAVRVRDRFWTSRERLVVSSAASASPKHVGDLVIGSAGMGLTVEDGAVRVQARLGWKPLRGELRSVDFEVGGAGADLQVTGTNIGRWTRTGSTVHVELAGPTASTVMVLASWSTQILSATEASFAIPKVEPLGVLRVGYSLQLARAGDREVVPALKGWSGVRAADLPQFGEGLVLGTPTSAYTASSPGASELSLLRFTPVEGPSTLVDVAAYTGALSAGGRLLLRAHYTVRNDRSPYLRVQVPPHTTLISARVQGEVARVARTGDAYLIPLVKSVETVEGLLNFPVQVVFLSDGVDFSKREERQISLPVLSAPVAVTRVEMSLPVGWKSTVRVGDLGVVSHFSEGDGIRYGFRAGSENIARADALFQDALARWMANDFAGSEDALGQLEQLGGDNENVQRLRSNLALVLSDEEQDAVLSRRVKDQARARAESEKRAQQSLESAAERALNSGDYERAEVAYKQALKIGNTLELLEQKESVEEEVANQALRTQLTTVRKLKKKQQRRAETEQSKVDRTNPPSVTTAHDFEDVAIDGDIVPADRDVLLQEPVDSDTPSVPNVGGVVLNRVVRAPLRVAANTDDVIVPRFGQTVRYQHLLLSEDQIYRVTIRATKKRGR